MSAMENFDMPMAKISFSEKANISSLAQIHKVDAPNRSETTTSLCAPSREATGDVSDVPIPERRRSRRVTMPSKNMLVQTSRKA